eukprot:1011927-Prorocentrum_minimum.AAC.1
MHVLRVALVNIQKYWKSKTDLEPIAVEVCALFLNDMLNGKMSNRKMRPPILTRDRLARVRQLTVKAVTRRETRHENYSVLQHEKERRKMRTAACSDTKKRHKMRTTACSDTKRETQNENYNLQSSRRGKGFKR